MQFSRFATKGDDRDMDLRRFLGLTAEGGKHFGQSVIQGLDFPMLGHAAADISENDYRQGAGAAMVKSES